VKLSNILILHQGGGSKEDAAVQPPEIENVYPEPNRFGPMPAHGFFLRHVKGIQISNADVRYEKEDLRPAFVLEDVLGVDMIHVVAQRAPDVPTFVLKNVEDFSIHLSRPIPDTHLDKVEQKVL
jgi:hypothetical protein